jgi:hypothetical protein
VNLSPTIMKVERAMCLDRTRGPVGRLWAVGYGMGAPAGRRTPLRMPIHAKPERTGAYSTSRIPAVRLPPSPELDPRQPRYGGGDWLAHQSLGSEDEAVPATRSKVVPDEVVRGLGALRA